MAKKKKKRVTKLLKKKKSIPEPPKKYDRLCRLIREGDLLVQQKDGCGLNELLYVSLSLGGKWYVSKVVSYLYKDPDTEYLPVPESRDLVMERATFELDDTHSLFILRRIGDREKLKTDWIKVW